ncbi:LuxR family maltose regulon positive regulatory protein [Kribbella antiqua]|uniref:LuxR family maltose regulon positive regulatory protein n=1 Tax=Kribbella antiqua TaxID=2512217 RepID=A0A4R2J1K5_9ACTN|nr:LuxR family maltose regulon positive regulatory protein [Kribbella antiqua]
MLATKLFPPTRRSELVARPRLADRLDSTLNRGHRLTLVSAPAGFGKTTLLSDWATSQERVGWLSLDEGDNALPRFLAHFRAALSGVGLDMDPAALDALAAGSTSVVLAMVVNELVRAGRQRPDSQWLLVLDDYHVIEAPEVHEAMTFLLDHGPDQLHLLVATRSDPPLPLSRLRSRGQLTEVRAADLRFEPAEAREFLNEMMALRLTEGDVRALEERTEGWIAGLQLAALSLRDASDRGDVAEFIGAFTGSNRFVIDYLVDEVLARQGADVRDFLLRTAILDRLTGSLCDAVTGGTDGGQVLADLDRRNVFMVPLDAERSWYRYHHLFGDVLRARLMAENPEQVPTLHQAASDWFASHQLAADAVRHSLAAGDYDRAAYLMEEALPEMRRTRQDSVMLGWMRSLPESVVKRSPVLSIMAGWSLMMAGDLDGMERRLDDVESVLAAGAHDQALAATWADTEDLRTAPATLWIYRAALAQGRGDLPAIVRHARRALELAGADDHFVRGAAGGFLGLAGWAAGDVQEALSTFSEAVRSLHAAGNLVDELDSTVVLGDMWISAGRPHRARRLYERALETATGAGEPYPRATADLHVGLAELDRELDDLVSAEEHLETARVLGERGSITENRHRWYVAMAHVRAATGDHASARQLLDQAESLYRPGSYPDLRPLAAMKARVHIAEGDLAAAEEWADEHGVTAADEASFLREYDHLTLVRLLLAGHDRDSGAGAAADPAALGDVLGLLDRLHADADRSRAGSLLEIGMLRALTLQARGHRSGALAELNRALVQAPEPDGYVRLFLDEGAPMLALLHGALGPEGGEYDVLRQHARRLLEAAPSAPAAVPLAGRGSLADPLSDRELDVLRLLASELTGPEIARQLFVSVNTLRTHTKRIFTKLDVNTRAAAVRRGHELGLL